MVMEMSRAFILIETVRLIPGEYDGADERDRFWPGLVISLVHVRNLETMKGRARQRTETQNVSRRTDGRTDR